MGALKKLILICIVAILSIGSINAFAEGEKFEDRNDESLQRVVVIDPGHGGNDGGAKSKNGVLEKDLNLEISIKLKEVLIAKGYKVYLTREGDEELSKSKKEDLALRCKRKKDVESDIFISIHQNMFNKLNCKGAQVWHASNDKSKMLAMSIQETIKKELQKENERLPKDAKKAYRILRDGDKGGNVILECGFISNVEDEKNLQDKEYQKKLAEAIGNGVDKYFSKFKID